MQVATNLLKPRNPPPREHDEYLRHVCKGDQLLLCTAMAELVIQNKAHSLPQPWPTLVLGSGCTPVGERTELLAMPSQLRSPRTPLGCELPESLAGESPREIAAMFTHNLITDRLGPFTEVEADRPAQSETFQLLLAAALLSNVFHRIKARGFTAPSRYEQVSDAHLGADATDGDWIRLEALHRDLLNPLRRLLASLLAVQRDSEWGTALYNLLLRLRHDLAGPQVCVRWADLRSLVELAWCHLVTSSSPSSYLGWNDLLLELSNYDPPGDSITGTPLFRNLAIDTGPIWRRYEAVTRSSFTAGASGSIHQNAANLLLAQHARRVETVESKRPPHAIAYVTSFDLEMELALLRRGRPFTLALPAHLVVGEQAHTVWLSLEVIPTGGRKDVDLLLDGGPGARWSLLDEDCAENAPVVVRLSGCPLVRLPDLAQHTALRDELVDALRPALLSLMHESWRPPEDSEEDPEDAFQEMVQRLSLSHALIICEHDALIHASVDQASMIMTMKGDSKSSGRATGLPARFASGNSRYKRFWMMLGAQIHHGAMRHRLATLLAMLPQATAPLPRRKRHRNGVAVNQNSTHAERDVLFWNGFDVVSDDITNFKDDLEHLLAHVEQKKPFTPQGCTVE